MLSDLSVQHLSFTSVFFIGCLLVLCSAFCWALYTLVGKRLLQTYDSFVITMYAFVFGTIIYIPFVMMDITPVLFHISMNGWLAIIYLALTCSIFGYLGWYYALRRIDASKAAVFLNFIPLFTILMSILLGQQLTWFFFLGALLIIYGVYITQK
jgi:drug/metabolite transporter (DMT)-like permease